MSPLLLLRIGVVAAAGLALWGGIKAVTGHYIQRGVALEQAKNTKAALEDAQVAAKETQRRLDQQEENQRAHNAELAAARSAAARNGRAAEQLRHENAAIVQQWRGYLGDTAAVAECAPAGDAIGVLADVLGRADRRAGVLADYADAARAAGLKCERDYDALTGARPAALRPAGGAPGLRLPVNQK